MGDPEFWNNQEKARATNSRISSLKKKLNAFQKLNGRYDDLMAGIELAREFDDDSAAADAFTQAAELDKDIASLELLTLLDKPGDMAS
jgi:peptide chain release factor 2